MEETSFKLTGNYASSYQWIIQLLLFLTPVTAVLNGWWIVHYNGSGTVGQVIAVIVQMISLFIIFRLNMLKTVILIGLACVFMISLLLESYNTGGITGSIVWFVRVFYTVSLFIVTFLVLKTYIGDYSKLLRKFSQSGILIGWLLVSSDLLHLGYATYQQGVGMKGLFYGQNDLSATMAMLFPFVIYSFRKRMTWLGILNIIIYVFGMLIIGTKTAYLFVLLVPLIMVWYTNKKLHLNFVRRILSISLILMFFMVAALVVMTLMKNSLDKIINYQMYFYNHSHSLSVYLLSGRTNTLRYLWTLIKNNPWVLIFGTGFQTGNNLLSSYAGVPIILEFDPLSLFLSGGIVAVLYVLFIYKPAITALRKQQTMEQKVTFLAMLIGFFCSVFSGHVLESALAGTYMSLIAAMYGAMPYGFSSMKRDTQN